MNEESSICKSGEEDLKTLYKYMRNFETKLGGGEGFEGVYGTITFTGMHEIIRSLEHHCRLTKDSSFVDVGSGLGRPLLHVSLYPGISKVWGIEMDSVKVQKALAFLRQVRFSMEGIGRWPDVNGDPPKITHASIENIESLDSYTHTFSFWEGIPTKAKEALGRLFSTSTSMIGIAIVQRTLRKSIELEMEKLGFHGLSLMQTCKVKMAGSGQTFSAYIFLRNRTPLPDPLLSTPKRRSSRCHSELPQSSNELSVLRKSLVNMALTEPPISKTWNQEREDSGLEK